MFTIVKKFSYVNSILLSSRLSFVQICKCFYFKNFQNDDSLNKASFQSLEKLNQNSQSNVECCYQFEQNEDYFYFSKEETIFNNIKNDKSKQIMDIDVNEFDEEFCFHNTNRQWAQKLKQEFFLNTNTSRLSPTLKSLWFSYRNKKYQSKFVHNSLTSTIFESENFHRMLNILEKELELNKKEGSLFLCSLRFNSKLCFSQAGVERIIFDFENVIQYLKCHFTVEEIKNSPYLLILRYSTLQNRIQFLKDSGVKHLKTLYIKNYRYIIKFNENELKKFGIIEEDVNVINCMLNCLKDLSNEEKQKFKENLSIQSSIFSLKTDILVKYLKRNVQDGYYNFPRLIFNSHICLTKLFNIFQKCDKLDFPSFNITMSSWKTIFEIKQSILDDLFERIPRLYGPRILEFVLIHPNVLKLPYNLLLDKLHLLKNCYQLKDEQIELKPTAMRIRIDLLKSRFEYLITMFGPTILEHPNILSLVALPKKKINQLFEKDSFVNNLHHNLENNIYFKFWTNTGKLKFEKKKKYESLSKLVGISQLQIKRQLKNHPFKSYIDVDNSKKVWDYFLSEQLTSNQILNGLLVILYDYDLIKKTWIKLKESEMFKEWKSDENLLTYLVYLIERENHFNGKAVMIGKNLTSEVKTLGRKCYLSKRVVL